jgi:hypothetical protein
MACHTHGGIDAWKRAEGPLARLSRHRRPLGRKIGEYVVKNLMQPAAVADVR